MKKINLFQNMFEIEPTSEESLQKTNTKKRDLTEVDGRRKNHESYSHDSSLFCDSTESKCVLTNDTPFEDKEKKDNSYTKDCKDLLDSGDDTRSQLAHKRWRFISMDSFESDDDLDLTGHRLVTKSGYLHVQYVNTPGLNETVLKDIFHTLMESKWTYFMLLFTMTFLISWSIFAAIWYIIYVVRRNKMTCVNNVDSFLTAFLFSIETQVTIGYGGRSLTSNCPEGVFLLIIQTMFGTFINSALLGLLFAKLGHPKNRGKTIIFSKDAVITLRDGKYCLIYKYVDLREKKLLDSNMRLVIVSPKLTPEGEFLPMDMADLALTVDHEQIEYTMRIFPLYPLSMIHVIDEKSPLYRITKDSIEKEEFEIISILEGTVPGTGSTTKAITSFKPTEILWGHRFHPIHIEIQNEQTNCIDLSTFGSTYKEHHTPDYSAEKFNEIKRRRNTNSSSSIYESSRQFDAFLNNSIEEILDTSIDSAKYFSM